MQNHFGNGNRNLKACMIHPSTHDHAAQFIEIVEIGQLNSVDQLFFGSPHCSTIHYVGIKTHIPPSDFDHWISEKNHKFFMGYYGFFTGYLRVNYGLGITGVFFEK